MRSDIEFAGHGDVTLRGWVYTPEGDGPFPALVMSHGLSAVKEQRLESYAEEFCRAGLLVLLYDHRNLGSSDGEPRQLVNPWAQTRDIRRAVDWLSARPDVDGDRIGLWGTSLSGGEVVVLAAVDPRIGAVVANAPFLGYGDTEGDAVSGGGDNPREAARRVLDAADGVGIADRGEVTGPLVLMDDEKTDADPLFPGPAAATLFASAPEPTTWRNSIHVQSAFTDAPLWNPGAVMAFVEAPVLLVVASRDDAAPADVAAEALTRAQGPTRLETLDCGHFDAYVGEHFERAVAVMVEFLDEHLQS